MDHLTAFVTYVAIIAVAAERLTDIVKRTFLEKRNVKGWVYQLLTFTFGFILAMTQPPTFDVFGFNSIVVACLIGLTVSGTSSFWHEVLMSLNGVNNSLKTSNQKKT